MATPAVGIILILVGLLIAHFSSGAGRIAFVFWWIGVIVAIIGVVLLAASLIILLRPRWPAGH
jgi:hypothetical protein